MNAPFFAPAPIVLAPILRSRLQVNTFGRRVAARLRSRI